MNKKYIKYIEYVVSDIEAPYFKYMKDNYGLSEKECELVLSKIYNEPVRIKGRYVYNTNGNEIYYEFSNGNWYKQEYDTNGNQIYFEDSNGGYWNKHEYDTNGNIIYSENSNGYWVKSEYDKNGNMNYYENSDGFIIDNR